MKNKFTIFFLLATLITNATFAQSGKNGKSQFPVIVAESGIRSITASSNIDLLLINAGSEDVKTTVPAESVGNLKISYLGGNLNLASKGYLSPGQRIPVYVYVSELETLDLSGDAFARSRDILQLGNLKINIHDDARVALKSRGKVKVNAPQDYQMLEEERYHIVLSNE
jgi:hypothetical protein